ncbi:MAG: SIS domain-containing protein [Candidatus Glassbacteria bacterium]|nr:SIS domain-containing protein [Candidatus Glassbacteria bacterium]
MSRCYRDGGKVLLCGNGGSAADCEHWSAELNKGFRKKRPLPEKWRKKLPPLLAGSLQQALPAIPLTVFAALNTAVANDISAELVFAQGVWALGAPGDILVGISTSGGARNVCAAVQAAEAKGLTTIGLTGGQGGRLGELASIVIRAPAGEVHHIQQYHLPIYHCLCLMLEDEFFA